MSEIKDGYKLKLQTPKTMKLFGTIKKWTDKTKNGENVPNLEVVNIVLVLVQCDLVDSYYQQYLSSMNLLLIF